MKTVIGDTKIKKRIRIIPALREKKRYLAFEIISDDPIKNFKAVSDEIKNKSLLFLGQLGLAKAGIRMLPEKWNPGSQKGLIKVSNKHVDELKSALTLVENINGRKAVVKSIGVSGMLDKAEQKYLK